MPQWFERYQQGLHQEVYDELLAMGESIAEPAVYEEALRTLRALMCRVRQNIELLIPRLQILGYRFGEGFAESLEEQAYWERVAPVYQPPTPETPKRVALLEERVGPLPLALRCWYEEVGSVNFVGLFPSSPTRVCDRVYGSTLDPLFLYSVELALEMTAFFVQDGTWEHDPRLSLSPDHWYKYGYSGSGPYALLLPCRAVDAPLLGEPHDTTFVNYLRLCVRWGGFPGLAKENRLTPDECSFLTTDLMPF